MTRETQDQRRRARGCGAECLCTRCLADDMEAHLIETGLAQQLSPTTVREVLRSGAPTEAPRKAGDGLGASGAARKTRTASHAQREYLAKLIEQHEMDEQARKAYRQLVENPELESKAASAVIDAIKAMPRRSRPQPQLEEDALYWLNGMVHWIRRSQRSGRLYALKIMPDGSTEYVPCAVDKIQPEWKLDLEDAAAWGRRHGVCCRCRAKLTNPKSIERGIGPVCAKAF